MADLIFLNAIAISTNIIRAIFSEELLLESEYDEHDALNINNYSVDVKTDENIIIDVCDVQNVSGDNKAVDIIICPSIDDKNISYALTVSPSIRGANGEILIEPYRLDILPCFKYEKYFDEIPEKKIIGNDIKNNCIDSYYEISENGDYRRHNGLEYLKKRCFRRLTTRKGEYIHDPTYGLSCDIKQVNSSWILMRLQKEIEEQILQEKDVKAIENLEISYNNNIVSVNFTIITKFEISENFKFIFKRS